MCKYTNYQRTCDILFTSFAITWIVTRLGVYPTWILYSTTIEAPQIVEMFPAYYIFNALLAILLMLHVIWTYFILKIVYKAMYTGKVILESFFSLKSIESAAEHIVRQDKVIKVLICFEIIIEVSMRSQNVSITYMPCMYTS